jgi:thymidylate kinase
MTAPKRGRVVYLSGIDGTGKTTQAELLVASFRASGIAARYVWLRFPQYLSLPVLGLSRLLGVTRYRTLNGQRVGHWEFGRARWLARLLLWAQVVDARIAAARRIEPLLAAGVTVVVDRFVYDIVVDIASAADEPSLLDGRAARRLLQLVDPASAILLDAPVDIIRRRRRDLEDDDSLGARADLYRRLAARLGVQTIDATQTRDAVQRTLVGRAPSSLALE